MNRITHLATVVGALTIPPTVATLAEVGTPTTAVVSTVLIGGAIIAAFEIGLHEPAPKRPSRKTHAPGPLSEPQTLQIPPTVALDHRHNSTAHTGR